MFYLNKFHAAKMIYSKVTILKVKTTLSGLDKLLFLSFYIHVCHTSYIGLGVEFVQ